MVARDLESNAIQKRQVASTCAWIISFPLDHHFSGRLKLLPSHYQHYFLLFTFLTNKIKALPLMKIIAKITLKLLKRTVFQNSADIWLVNFIWPIPPMKTHKRTIQRNSGTFIWSMLQFACLLVSVCLLRIFIFIFSLWKCQIDIFVTEHLALVWLHVMSVSSHRAVRLQPADCFILK